MSVYGQAVVLQKLHKWKKRHLFFLLRYLLKPVITFFFRYLQVLEYIYVSNATTDKVKSLTETEFILF